MPRTQARLPDQSGIGYGVMLLAICTLIALNSVVTSTLFSILRQLHFKWLEDARFGQPLLFLTPLLLLSLELWFFSILRRGWKRN